MGDGHPLIQKINQRTESTVLNGSVDESIEYSTFEPDAPALPPASTRTVVAGAALSSTGNQMAQADNFDPAVALARVKKCSNCLIIFGWIMIVCGGINIVCNAI